MRDELTAEERELCEHARDELTAEYAGDGEWHYWADERRQWYMVTDDEMVDLGRRIAAGGRRDIVYSRWCADTTSRPLRVP